MPVTARLSRQFYDRLGEQVTDELVEWFNQVDASYKADLRELNEMNFARFEAKLEQRLAEQNAWIDKRFAEFEVRIEKRFAEFDVKFAGFDVKFAGFDVRFAQFEARMERRLADQTRFLYFALATQIALIAGLYFR